VIEHISSDANLHCTHQEFHAFLETVVQRSGVRWPWWPRSWFQLAQPSGFEDADWEMQLLM